MTHHRITVDAETWQALNDHAETAGENVAAIARDALRAYLRRRGYTFSTTPPRYNRRGNGRRTQ